MKLVIINSAPFTQEFVEPIKQCLQDSAIDSEVVGYDAIPTDLTPFSGVIISASPKGDDIIDEQISYYEWIYGYQDPVLGICHGHQMLGVMHGADLIRSGQGEEGIYPVIVETDSPLFSGLGQSFKAEQHHVYSISLPNNFRLLASSDRCRVQAMMHQSKPLCSVQFHAEKNPGIILNFANMVNNFSL